MSERRSNNAWWALWAHWGSLSLWVAYACIGLPLPAVAQEQEEEYLERLAIAEKAVKEQRAARLEQATRKTRTDGVASAVAEVLRPEPVRYRLGQRWSVATIAADATALRKSMAPEDLREARRSPSYFDYLVSELDPEGLVRITATPRSHQLSWRGRAVKEVVLTLKQEDRSIVAREVRFTEGSADRLSAQAPDAPVHGFEPYPIAVPVFALAGANKATALPERLSELSGVPSEQLEGALEVQSKDLYGRPVRTLWREGDPWPLYEQIAAGEAYLLQGSQP